MTRQELKQKLKQDHDVDITDEIIDNLLHGCSDIQEIYNTLNSCFCGSFASNLEESLKECIEYVKGEKKLRTSIVPLEPKPPENTTISETIELKKHLNELILEIGKFLRFDKFIKWLSSKMKGSDET